MSGKPCEGKTIIIIIIITIITIKKTEFFLIVTAKENLSPNLSTFEILEESDIVGH